MNNSTLQPQERLSLIDIDSAISCIIAEYQPNCEDLYEPIYNLIREKNKTLYRLVVSKKDEQENEYSNLTRTQLNELNINYSDHRVILAINPGKLPEGFIPYSKPKSILDQ